jgi:hypothetical protein
VLVSAVPQGNGQLAVSVRVQTLPAAPAQNELIV